MRFLRGLGQRLRALLLPGRVDRELRDEVDFHLEMEAAKHRGAGLSERDAAIEARRRFGNVARQQERARDAWGWRVLLDVVMDLRRGTRQLRRAPGFTLAAVTTLALGIGATSAMFGIAWQVYGNHPPVEDPSGLVAIYTTCRRGQPQCSSSWADFVDYRDQSRSLADAGAYTNLPLNVSGSGDEGARFVTGELVTGNLFGVLGMRPSLGRLITPEDDRAGSPAPVVVLSEELWRTMFGGDSALVGEEVRLNGVPYTVIGIAAPQYRGLSLASPADVWTPIFGAAALGLTGGDRFTERGSRWIGTIIGRIRPGGSVSQVSQEMDLLARALGGQYPEARAAVGGVRGITVDAIPGYIMPLGSEAELERFLGLLLAVVGATLLIATVNVANLLLARASVRARELGVQLAIGAQRGRLVRQLLTESLLLGTVGGAAGLGVALVVLQTLGAYELPGGVSIERLGAGLDLRVLFFTLGISLVSATGFGLLPALRATRKDLVTAIKGDALQRDRQRMRRGLVALQVALCVTLLFGSGLFLRTLRNSLNEPLGFQPRGAIAARFNLNLLQYNVGQTQAFANEVSRRIRELPGVQAASVSTLAPFQRGGFRGIFVDIPGYTPAPDEEIRFDYVFTTPGYFQALGIPVLAGRPFETTDRPDGPAVAVVNRFAAERYWPGSSPIGRQLRFSQAPFAFTIVGVVENPTWTAVGETPTPFVFVPMAQFPDLATSGFLTLVARTDGPEDRLLPAVRDAIRAVEPRLSLTLLEPLDDMVGAALMPQRVGGLLLSLLGALALILAAVGIYGVVAYTVTLQAKEIGIRMALGAANRQIILGVTSGMALPVLLGLGAGAGAALYLSRMVATFLYGISSGDLATLVAMVALLVAVAALAMAVPARRALRLDPVTALRSE